MFIYNLTNVKRVPLNHRTVNHRGDVTLLFCQSKIYVGQSNIMPSSPIYNTAQSNI